MGQAEEGAVWAVVGYVAPNELCVVLMAQPCWKPCVNGIYHLPVVEIRLRGPQRQFVGYRA